MVTTRALRAGRAGVRGLGTLATGLSLALGSGGCASLLGIEDAECVGEGCPGVVDGGAETAGGDEPVQTQEALCQAYCDEMDEACSDLPQYLTREACEAVCVRGLKPGEPGDDGVDTIECRRTHARSVRTFGEPEAGCQAAGASGGGSCGDVCEVYCNLVGDVCADFFDSAFTSFTDCFVDCQGTPVAAEPYQAPAPAGDTLQCRIYHTMNAFGSASTHCIHALGVELCAP